MDSFVNHSTKNKHLTLADRVTIQNMLGEGHTFREIGYVLGKDPSTVSKEVRKHIHLVTNGFTAYDEAGHVLNEECPLLRKPPYVCNGCFKKNYCRRKRFLYLAEHAQKEYEKLLSNSREGIPLNKAEFYEVEKIISKGLKSGQHLYQVLKANNLDVSLSTAYRYVKKGYCSATVMDLPRAVKFKPRKHPVPKYVPYGSKKGRTYEDFKHYTDVYGITDWVEMDTVIGRIGGKVILTFIFNSCNFMFGRLMDSKSASETAKQFHFLRSLFSEAGLSFRTYFPLILTDNGGEFADINAIERDRKGNVETRLFFCDPMRSCQKPSVEKNHTLLRDICPKGCSFDMLDQKKLNIIFSHMNSTARRCFNGRTPYEMFSFMYSEKVANMLGIQQISAKDVIQTPRLLHILGVEGF